MRTSLAVGFAVAFGTVIGGAAVFVVVEKQPTSWFERDRADVPPTAAPTVEERPSHGATPFQPDVSSSVANRMPPRATTPVHGHPQADPRTIYRCRAEGRTTYSNSPCSDGSVVDDSSAVTGYDSRPSAALQRLIAEGRDGAADPQPASRPSRASDPRGPRPYDSCAAMRRQLVDIDNQMRLPSLARTLDYWRALRQDIATGLLRERC